MKIAKSHRTLLCHIFDIFKNEEDATIYGTKKAATLYMQLLRF